MGAAMRVSIAQLQAAGMTNDQIVKLMKEREADRREQNRKAQINHRARQHEGDLRADIADTNIEVSKKEIKEVSIPRKTRTKKPTTPLPENWHPELAGDLEFEKFCDHARQNDRHCVDWEAALRNWRRNAPRFNGGQGGSLHVRPSGQQAGGLAEAIAKVRSRLGADADRPPDVLVPQDRLPKPRGFHRDAGGDLGGLPAGDRGIRDRPENGAATPMQVATDTSGGGRSMRGGNRLADENSPELKLVAGTEVAAATVQRRG
jgi:DNA-binding transcriptional MerR regulator